MAARPENRYKPFQTFVPNPDLVYGPVDDPMMFTPHEGYRMDGWGMPTVYILPFGLLYFTPLEPTTLQL